MVSHPHCIFLDYTSLRRLTKLQAAEEPWRGTHTKLHTPKEEGPREQTRPPPCPSQSQPSKTLMTADHILLLVRPVIGTRRWSSG